jgi:2,4-dienoyl-CoA reductase-like NADH-dependent reductase (Old Yellow Enzyme family)
MANLKLTIREELTLNGYDQGATNSLTISGINELSKRIVTATTTEAGLLGFLSALSSVGVTANKVGYLAGILDDGDVRYIRITNLDDSNHITLTFRDEDNTEFRMKVDAGHSFIYPGDNSGGVVDTMKAAGSALASGLADLVDITVDADTASCDVEVYVASV